MPTPETSLVVIACPNCGMRYQVAYAAIGAKGRSVACAQCGQSWEAHAEPPRPVAAVRQKDFGELAEEALDEKIILEEQRQRARREASARAQEAAEAAKAKAHADVLAASEARAAARAAEEKAALAAARGGKAMEALVAAAEAQGAPSTPEQRRTLDEIKAALASKAAPPAAEAIDPADKKRQQREFSQRQRILHNSLPMARVRRMVRTVVLGAVIVVIGGGVLFRSPLVQQFPQLAGGYAAIGLPVNVIGLEFSGVRTLKSLQQGAQVLTVEGTIRSVSGGEVAVPQVIVTLVAADGGALYQWSMVPKATELEPGETLPFETQLTAPPAGAMGVKLSFGTGRAAARPPQDGDAVAAPAGADGAMAAAPPQPTMAAPAMLPRADNSNGNP